MPRIPFRILLAAAFGCGTGFLTGIASAQQVYLLETICSTAVSKAFPCTVEAFNVEDATEYRHAFDGKTVSYRVIEDPYVRIQGRRSDGSPWLTVRNAWINFKTNELCFNDRVFCVINPTFLDDVKASGGGAFEGRELVGLAFANSGRVDVACFDNGCARLLEAIGR
jgi:hypothetical protein